MLQMRIILLTLRVIRTMMMNFTGMKKLEISDTLIEASWIWAILAMEMVFSWKNSMQDPTGNFREPYNSLSSIRSLFCKI